MVEPFIYTILILVGTGVLELFLNILITHENER